ncbi:MAG: hypothetical protein ACODAF_03085 [Actinomycetota bacterium]
MTVRLRQWMKRIPGVQQARRRMLRAVRGSPAMRSLIRQVYAVNTESPVPVDVAPGNVLGGVGTEALPVVLVVVVGADTQTVEATVDEVARLQLLGAGFRPVFVTDTPAFAATRRYGYPVELLTEPVGSGDALRNDRLRERLALLFATYRATASVALGPRGLDEPARLVLSSLRPEHQQTQ